MAVTDRSILNDVPKAFVTLDSLFEAEDAVKSLLQHPGWTVIQTMLSRQVEDVTQQLERVKPLEQAEYAAGHARVGGLKAAERTVVAIIAVAQKRREQAEREAEAGDDSSAER